jgi:hypothetical protein
VFFATLAGIRRLDLLADVPHQAPAALQMAGELIDELFESTPTLGACGILVVFRDGRRHGQVIANEQRHRLDQDRLIALEPFKLSRQLVEALRRRNLPALAAFRL